MSIDTKKLRDSAEKMLSFGGWSKSRAHIAIAESEEWCSVQVDVRANRLAARKVAGYLKEVEPKTIVSMLDHIDAQAAEIAEARGQIEHLDRQNNALRDALGDLIRGYVNMMENGRDRIVFLGGDCDSVDAMEASDPWLKAARAALAQHQGEKHGD